MIFNSFSYNRLFCCFMEKKIIRSIMFIKTYQDFHEKPFLNS